MPSERTLPGSWKDSGFVVPVPAAMRPHIQVVRVRLAAARVLQINSALCYVVIPNDAPDPDQWRVTVENGALKIKPPREQSGGVTNIATGNARVGMQVGVVHGGINVRGHQVQQTRPQITVGVVLPRRVPSNDWL